MTKTTSTSYQTRELAIATFLYMRSGCMPTFSWQGNRCTFVFELDEVMRDLVRQASAGEALVEPVTFTMRQSDVKRAMFALRPHAS